MIVTVVDRLHREFSDLLGVLESAGEPSLRSVADDNLRKSLLMASASYLERRMTEAVLEFVAAATAEDHILTWLVKNKVVSRQYHTWFDWEKKNANNFFGLFGVDFRDSMKKFVDKDVELKASIEAFLEVGRERNRLVHQDFGSFTMEKTSNEIYELYSIAIKFVDWFPVAITNYANRYSGNVGANDEHAIIIESNAPSG
jgi:hypothetical protein